jgi:hypothetical protein
MLQIWPQFQQMVCLHAMININRFSYIYVISDLSDMTKVYTVQSHFMRGCVPEDIT